MSVRDFITVVRELSFEHLRNEALLAPRLLVVARDHGPAALCREQLFGKDAEDFAEIRASTDPAPDPLQYDVIVTVGPLDPGMERTWRDLFRRVNEPLRVVQVDPMVVTGGGDPESVRRRISDAADERALAIGRYIEAMRRACADQIVSNTSTVNGEFALISNLPTILPVVGNLVAVGADFLVLTKNQLMMLYRLAAIYQRDLDDRWRIYAEMIPVVGSGLVWRTVAREVCDLLPLAIGTVPKVAIAYAGTYAIGRAAQVYYEQGIRLSREQVRELYQEAILRLRQNPPPIPRVSLGRPRLNGRSRDEAVETPPPDAEVTE